MTEHDTRRGAYEFLHCPFDGQTLSTPQGTPVATCPQCGFAAYRNPAPCVAVLVEKNGAVLLARRAIDPGRGLWDVPGGFIEAGETAEEAVAREIHEETGLLLDRVRYLTSLPDTYGGRGMPTLSLCYTAVPVNWPPRISDEAVELALFPPDSLPSDLAFPHERKLLAIWVDLVASSHRNQA